MIVNTVCGPLTLAVMKLQNLKFLEPVVEAAGIHVTLTHSSCPEGAAHEHYMVYVMKPSYWL